MRHIIILAMLCPFLSMCQPLSLKGKVINEQKQPVTGATITTKRVATGIARTTVAFTNNAGEFSLRHLGLGDTIIVTAVGYEPFVQLYDYTIVRESYLAITLRKRISILDEVVINTGYQSLPKERATGSFENISNTTLNLQAGSNIIERLRGVSSVFFDDNRLRQPLTIRGPSSILGDKDPLIIVDNFPFNGDIDNINPADIESVTILKDAAAASIWGTKAGNGVIVITTKKGKQLQPLTIQFSSGISLSEKPELYYQPAISPSDFVDVETFLFSKDFRFYDTLNRLKPAFSPVYEILFQKKAGQISDAKASILLNELKAKDVRSDLEKYIYRPALHEQHAMNLRGGSADVSWYFSAGFDNKIDNLEAGYKRLTLSSKNEFRLSPRLLLSSSLFFSNAWSRSGKPSYDVLSQWLYPYSQLTDENGMPMSLTRSLRQSYVDTAGAGRLLDWTYYPLEDYKHNVTTSNIFSVVAGAGLKYTLFKTLGLDVKYQYQKQQTETGRLQDQESYYSRDLVNRFSRIDWTTGNVIHNVPPGAIADNWKDAIVCHNLRSQLAFQSVHANNQIVGVAGFELRQVQGTSSSNRIYGYNPDILTVANVDYVNAYPDYVWGGPSYIPSNNSFSGRMDHFVSFYANAAYKLKNKYTLSASARRDASNLFGVSTNKKWQPLWSAGVSWKMSAEDFFKTSMFSYLNWRLTYGFTGNVDQNRSALTTIGYSSRSAGYTNLPFANVQQFADPSLRWEKQATLNMAADFTLAHERIGGTVEYYIKKGNDLFGNAPVDYTSVPLKTLTTNIADMKGSGIDISLNTINIDRKLKWSTSLQFSYSKSKVTKYFLVSPRGFDHISAGTKITAIEGYPLYSVLSFAWAGLDSLGNPVAIVNKQHTTRYSSVIGTDTQISDLIYSGPATPPVFGNLTNSFTVGNITLSAAILYKFGFFFRKNSINYDLLFMHQGHADFARRWQKPGDETRTFVPSMIYPNSALRDAFYTNSEVLVRRGDNIRLQFVRLEYNWCYDRQKAKSPGVQLYVVASNLGILWRANLDHIDPDYGDAIPTPRSVAFGAILSLK